MTEPKPRPIKRPWEMASYWLSQWPLVALITVCGLLFNGGMSLGPVLQGSLVDALAQRAALPLLLRRSCLFFGVILAIQILRALKRYFVRLFANRTIIAMRGALYHNILSQSVSFLARENAGDLLNKASADVDICVEGMRKVTTEIFDTGVLMLSYLITMLIYDRRITLLACLFVPAAMGLAGLLKRTIVRRAAAAREESSRVADLTYDFIDHALLYRVNNAEERCQKEYGQALAELERRSVRASVLENSMRPVYNAISMLGVGGVFLLGGQMVIDGQWTVGALSAYLVIFMALTTKASKAGKLFNSVQKASVSWRRIQPYLTSGRSEEKRPPDAQTPLDQVEVEGEGLEVRDLSFTYPDGGEPALRGVSLRAMPGQIVGVTGAVASGKSTLGLALTGLYPYQGSVKLAGRQLADWSAGEREALISYAGHQPLLLSDSIEENIRLGREGAVDAVLADVCFGPDLADMPLGVKTLVGNRGVRLSGGQQARLSLARALFHPGRLLILDDPFASVDKATEREIMANLRRGYADRIILLISHRLALFDQTDSVLFLGRGETVQSSHRELLKTCPEYAGLVRLQRDGAAGPKEGWS